MRLTKITITGADDGVDPRALAVLSEKYPFVEWGLLLSKKRFGEARYPSSRWLLEVPKVLGFDRLSYHLCGEFSRRVMGGDPTMVPREIKRIQLNGFSEYRLPCLVAAEMCRELEFILQCNTIDAIDNACELRSHYTNVVALWDPSCGTGKPFDGFMPTPQINMRCGYAGGINEGNIEKFVRENILAPMGFEPIDSATTWIDLETGARTDDKFDIAKVERILKLAAPFVMP